MFTFRKRLFFLILIFGLILLMGGYPSPAESTSSSCLDCHTNLTNLKKITQELAKSKPKKSAETAGEG